MLGHAEQTPVQGKLPPGASLVLCCQISLPNGSALRFPVPGIPHSLAARGCNYCTSTYCQPMFLCSLHCHLSSSSPSCSPSSFSRWDALFPVKDSRPTHRRALVGLRWPASHQELEPGVEGDFRPSVQPVPDKVSKCVSRDVKGHSCLQKLRFCLSMALGLMMPHDASCITTLKSLLASCAGAWPTETVSSPLSAGHLEVAMPG